MTKTKALARVLDRFANRTDEGEAYWLELSQAIDQALGIENLWVYPLTYPSKDNNELYVGEPVVKGYLSRYDGGWDFYTARHGRASGDGEDVAPLLAKMVLEDWKRKSKRPLPDPNPEVWLVEIADLGIVAAKTPEDAVEGASEIMKNALKEEQKFHRFQTSFGGIDPKDVFSLQVSVGPAGDPYPVLLSQISRDAEHAADLLEQMRWEGAVLL
jgi:hypothetical protein